MDKVIALLKPKKERKEIPFTIFVGFWSTYVFVRILLFLFPTLASIFNEIHIHHFSYGIIILTLVGFYSLVMNPHGKKLFKTAFVFGVGLAMTYDEFGMWLKLTDVGVARYGILAVATITIIFISILYLDHHWQRFVKKIRRLLFA